MNDRVLIRRLLTVGWIAAAVPIASSAFSAMRSGWIPFGDTAIVAAKVADVFGGDTPLVGGWTSLGQDEAEPLHHAGPLAIWLLATPTKLFGAPGVGMVLGAALIAIVSLFLIALLLRRSGRLGTEAVMLALVVGLVVRLGGERMVEPNAPHVGILPLLLSMVAALTVMNGRHRDLWVLIGAGSLAAQTHLGYAPLIAALLVLVAVAMTVDARADPDTARDLGRWTVPIAVVIGVVAWIGPIIDQLFGSQNLTRLAGARAGSDKPTVGWSKAIDLTADAASVPGGWLRRDAVEGMLPEPGWVALGWAGVMVLVVAGLAVWAWRSSERYDLSVAALGLTMLLIGTASASSVTLLDLGSGLLYYRFFWWPVGVVFTLAVLRAGALGLRSMLTARGQGQVIQSERLSVGAVGLVAIAAVLLIPAAHEPAVEDRITILEALVDHAGVIEEELGVEILLHLDDPAGVNTANDAFSQLLYAPTMIAELRIAGVELDFPDEPFDPSSLGPIAAYAFDHAAAPSGRPEVWFRAGAAALEDPPDGFTRVAFDEGSSDAPVRFATALWLQEH